MVPRLDATAIGAAVETLAADGDLSSLPLLEVDEDRAL